MALLAVGYFSVLVTTINPFFCMKFKIEWITIEKDISLIYTDLSEIKKIFKNQLKKASIRADFCFVFAYLC